MTHILVYVLKEKEHDLFKRENDDLIYNAKIPLGKALIGCFVELPTLDGRLLSVPINDIGKSVILMTHRIFKLSKPNLNLNSSDYRASKIISNDTELEPIPWEPNMKNHIFHFCVGV